MNFWASKLDRFLYFLIGLLFIVALGLTIMSWLEICTEACAEVHFYKYYGFDFELVGFFFFVAVTIMHFVSAKINWLAYIVGLMVAGAIGSEINFILVQKFVIQQWCPVCLAIAAVIGAIGILIIYRFLYRFFILDQPITWGKFMKAIAKILGSSAVLVAAYIISFYGVFKPEQSFAAGLEGQDVPYFGNQNSAVEVYYITDWFCPACKRFDPELESIYPRIMAKARLFFVDYPIHPETMNYIPYNLSFMLKDKKQYLKARKALTKLAKTTKTPTTAQVQTAVKPYGVTYEALNFADINDGIKFQEGIVKTFKVKQTPTVVVANRKKLKAKKLTGKSLTPKNIMRAIEDISSN